MNKRDDLRGQIQRQARIREMGLDAAMPGNRTYRAMRSERPSSALSSALHAWTALTALGAAALWAVSMSEVDVSRMGDLGLVSLIPPAGYAALLLLTISFCISIHQRQTPTLVLLLHVVLLIAIIHGTPPVLYGTLRYSWAWKHLGIVDYIQRHGSVNPSIPYLTVYHSWPGFFALVALATGILGADSALGVAMWAPPVNNLMFVGGLLLVLRAFTDDRRLLWMSAWLFIVTNWVGQDYFSPQAMAYCLYLIIIAISLRWLGEVRPLPFAGIVNWRLARPFIWLARRLFPASVHDPMIVAAPGSSQRIGFLAITIALFVVIVFSHQLTPFMATVAIAMLVVCRRCSARSLPILMGVLTVTYLLYVGSPFLRGNLYWIIEGILDPFGNFNSNLIDVALVSEGQRFVASVDRGLTASVGLLAVLGCVRRLRRGCLDLAAIIMVVAPMSMIALNSYGGEMVFRIYFFALPFACFFAAALLYPTASSPSSWWTTCTAILLSAALLAGLIVAYYGKDRMFYFTQGEIDASQYLSGVAPAGSLWLDGTWDWPLQYRHYEYYHYYSLAKLEKAEMEQLALDPLGVVSEIMGDPDYTDAYMIITRSQKAEVEMTGVMPPGSLDQIESALRQSPRFEIVFENADSVIFSGRDEVEEMAPR